MLYKRIEIVDGESIEPVSFVGVHPVNWPGWVGEPAVGFAEVDLSGIPDEDLLAETAKRGYKVEPFLKTDW